MFQRSICAWLSSCAPWYKPVRLPSPMVLAVANILNAGCGRITSFWSSSVNLPSRSRTRWITNITSGRPASYSSNTSATGRRSAHGTMPSWKAVTWRPSRSTTASRPTRSSRLTWPSRFTRTHGQLSRAATCSTWGDLPVPCRPCTSTRRLRAKPASMARVTSRLNRYTGSISGTCSSRPLNAGTSRSESMPNVSRTDTMRSGRPWVISFMSRCGRSSGFGFGLRSLVQDVINAVPRGSGGVTAFGRTSCTHAVTPPDPRTSDAEPTRRRAAALAAFTRSDRRRAGAAHARVHEVRSERGGRARPAPAPASTNSAAAGSSCPRLADLRRTPPTSTIAARHAGVRTPSNVILVLLQQPNRLLERVAAERVAQFARAHDLEHGGLAVVHLCIDGLLQCRADSVECIDGHALGAHGAGDFREARVAQFAGDEAAVVEVHLVLLLRAPLAVVEDHRGHRDVVAHAGQYLAHAHGPGAVAGVGD